MPRWALEEPQLAPGEDVYLEAFWLLSTERKSNGLGVSRIPWSVAKRYAVEELELGEFEWRIFWAMLSALDSAFLEWQEIEFNRNSSKGGEGSPKTATVKPSRYGR